MEQTEYLSLYDFTACETLLEETRKLFRAKGIVMPFGRKQSENAGLDTRKAANTSDGGIKEFFLPSDLPAFYLRIDSPDDLWELHKELEGKLSGMQEQLKIFLQNNSDLNEEIKKKLKTFAFTHLTRAKKILLNGVRTDLKKDLDTANSVQDMRDAAGNRYSQFLKREIIDRIMEPVYEGIRMSVQEADTEAEEAYRAVLQTMNDFFLDLGVMTIPVQLGEKMTSEIDRYYEPDEESNRFITADPGQKDIVREIRRYAYVFQEEKGSENRRIIDGSVVVMVYRPGGQP